MEKNAYMKLLIVAQAVDKQDPVLGFFVAWIHALAERADHVEVICLKKGTYDLPENVKVHSLGKEDRSVSRLLYAWRFLKLAWRLRKEYDTVLVHMNQEYVLIVGWLWRLLGKRVYLWRNHYAGSLLTDVAALFCTKIFCTSRHSYTAKFKKTIFMPIGVDTERFTPDERMVRVPRSILWLGRIAPSKRVEMVVEALSALSKKGIPFSATILGSPLPQDRTYYDTLVGRVAELGLASHVTFVPAISNNKTPDMYRAHAIFVNTSPSGMFDKTILEAAACGCRVLTTSDDVREAFGEMAYVASSQTLAKRLEEFIQEGAPAKSEVFVARHSLKSLTERLVHEMSPMA
jgi:glycosyltransferase involved in cell wall biosynthesis